MEIAPKLFYRIPRIRQKYFIVVEECAKSIFLTQIENTSDSELTKSTPKLFYRSGRMRVKKINVLRENAKSVCRILPIRQSTQTWAYLGNYSAKPEKTLGLISSLGMGRSKIPSHATVPLMMTTHENINIIWPKDLLKCYQVTWPILNHTYNPHTAKTQYRIWNKYCQERNCAATVPISTFMFPVSDLYIPLIGLLILLQEIRWAERGNICRSLTDTWMCKLGLRPRNSFFGNT